MYECENAIQVAHKVAELTNSPIDYMSWKYCCEELKKDGSRWFDYTAFDYKAFDSSGNKFDVVIFLGYDSHSRHYFLSLDPEENGFAKLEKELIETEDTHIEDIKKFKEKSELNTSYDVLADEKFHQLTKTLIKSLFKAIGTIETRKIPFIISNNMVFFNYNGIQYKYYPAQCKIFKKCGMKYQRINWNDFAEENNSDGQKQKTGRSPPFLLLI